VNVADEVDNPFECLLLLDETDGSGYSAARVICDSGDNTAFFRTVSLVYDVANLGWIV